jgi:hypothetical protein
MKLKYKIRYIIAIGIYLYAVIKGKDWFYLFLKFYVKDLNQAKELYNIFRYEWNEKIPLISYFGLRSICYHLSMVLEGYETDPNLDAFLTDYMQTRYGSEIYLN